MIRNNGGSRKGLASQKFTHRNVITRVLTASHSPCRCLAFRTRSSQPQVSVPIFSQVPRGQYFVPGKSSRPLYDSLLITFLFRVAGLKYGFSETFPTFSQLLGLLAGQRGPVWNHVLSRWLSFDWSCRALSIGGLRSGGLSVSFLHRLTNHRFGLAHASTLPVK